MNKKNLPQKICPVCDRPFSWRKKWKKDWEEVKYCSEKCKGAHATKLETRKIKEQQDLSILCLL